jgi:hypothetical protein
MADIPTSQNPIWRERLTVAAQLAGIIACCGVLTVATLTILNYLAH